MINKNLSIIFSNSLSLIKALIWVEWKLFSMLLKFLRVFLKHVSESRFLVCHELLMDFHDIVNIAQVSPLLQVFVFKQFFFFVVQWFLWFDKSVFEFISGFKKFSIRFMLKLLVLKARAKKLLVKFSLLLHETWRLSNILR